jgi:transcriptional regulator with XRE-family HTH domain
MKPDELRVQRMNRGWSQSEAARRLGVTQPYVVMLEKGRRPLTKKLARKLMMVFNLSPAVLPVSETHTPEQPGPQRLAEDFAVLGYPGYAYLRPHVAKKNPGEVLLTALAQNDLESRLVEALPWLPLRYWNMDFSWLVAHAKKFDLQNRLGFVVGLARQMSETSQNEERTRALSEVERTLDRSRLVREDDFLRPTRNNVERQWVMQNRSEEAKHWNLVTDLRPEHLSYSA